MAKTTVIPIALLMSCLFCAPIAPPDRASREVEDRIDGFIEEIMESYEVPGLALSVIKGGEIIFAKGYGYSDVKDQTPVTTSTIYSTASVTKVFVGTAMMQLVEQGKIDLNSPVIEYLPYFALDDIKYKEITVLQMLNHTSGMPDIEDINEYGWETPAYDDGALERYVRSIKTKRLVSSPGETANYSSMAYDVLGDVVAKVSGTTFENYVQTNILAPLKMSKSTLLYKAVDKEFLATPYQLKKNLHYTPSEVFPYSRMHPASGTLFSNVEDLSRWALANLNRGELDNRRFLKEQSYDLMWTLADADKSPFGISWMVEAFDEYTMVSHDGGDPGYRTELRMIPELSLAVILMRNCWEPPLDDLASFIVRIALEEDPDTRVVLTMGKLWKVLREDGVQRAIESYRSMRRDLGEEHFHPSQLNKIGMYLAWQDRHEDATKFYELNIEANPKISQLYDILADCYVEMGNVELAIQWYEKSLRIDSENEGVKEKLKKLITVKRSNESKRLK